MEIVVLPSGDKAPKSSSKCYLNENWVRFIIMLVSSEILAIQSYLTEFKFNMQLHGDFAFLKKLHSFQFLFQLEGAGDYRWVKNTKQKYIIRHTPSFTQLKWETETAVCSQQQL